MPIHTLTSPIPSKSSPQFRWILMDSGQSTCGSVTLRDARILPQECVNEILDFGSLRTVLSRNVKWVRAELRTTELSPAI